MDEKKIMEELTLLKREVENLKEEKKSITPHKHCLNCGIAIPPDKTFCSKKCEEQWNAMLKKKKINLYVWMAFMAILIVLLFVGMGGGL